MNAVSPPAAFDYLARGRKARQRGDLQQALECFTMAVLEFPECLDGYQELGSILVDLGRFSEAVEVYGRAILHAPSQVSLYKRLGFAQYQAGDYLGAAASFRTVLSLSPDDSGAVQSLAEIYRIQGRLQEALAVVIEAVQRQPDDVGLWKSCGALGRMVNREDLVQAAAAHLDRLDGVSLASRPHDALDCVNIEITTYCNFSCAGCYRTILAKQGKWNNRHMSVEEFRRIVDELPPTAEVLVYGVGEPSLHPRLPDLIAIAAAQPKFGRVVLTSDISARQVEYYLALFDSGLSSLTISVDALDQDLANELRAGTKVQGLAERIRILAAGRPGQIEIRTVVSTKNILTIPALLAALHELGDLIVHLQPYDDLGNPEGSVPWEERAWFVNEIPHVAATFPNLQVRLGDFFPSPAICRKPWTAPYVTVDGHLTPCCRITSSATFSFGSLFEASFSDVFHSPQARQWRQAFLSASPSVCHGCPMHLMRRSPRPELPVIHPTSASRRVAHG